MPHVARRRARDASTTSATTTTASPTSPSASASRTTRRARARCAGARESGSRRDVDLDHASYFLSRITIVPTDAPGMARWRKKLFIALARNAANPVRVLRPARPTARSSMGSHIEL